MLLYQYPFFSFRLIGISLITLFVISSFILLKKKQPDPLIYAYYTGDGGSGLHLAWSSDGYKWQQVRGGKSILKSDIGDYVMRDPHLSQTPDGMYHLVWATGTNRRDLGYAYSKNLLEWSAQRLIPVMEKDTLVLNAWGPEMVYNSDNQKFMMMWASTVPGKFKDTDKQLDSLPNGLHYNHRIYRKFTTDLKEWSATELFYDPGFNCTDPTIVADSGRNMMFVKDETNLPKNVQKNIRMTTCGSITGAYSPTVSLVSRRTHAEGPTATRLDTNFIVYYYKTKLRKMGAMVTRDFKKWKEVSDSLSFPKGVRHGSVLRIPQKMLDKLNES